MQNSEGELDCAPTRLVFDCRRKPTPMPITACRSDITHNAHEEIDMAKTVLGVNLLLNAVIRRAN